MLILFFWMKILWNWVVVDIKLFCICLIMLMFLHIFWIFIYTFFFTFFLFYFFIKVYLFFLFSIWFLFRLVLFVVLLISNHSSQFTIHFSLISTQLKARLLFLKYQSKVFLLTCHEFTLVKNFTFDNTNSPR